MDEIKNKQVFLVTNANFLGLSTEGVLIIPAIVHQQHGENVHCIVKQRDSDKELIVTVNESAVIHNIKDVMNIVNHQLLPTNKTSTNDLDKQSN
jgi:hypothetical protein